MINLIKLIKFLPLILVVLIFNITVNNEYKFYAGDFNEYINNFYFEAIKGEWDLRQLGFKNRQYGEYIYLSLKFLVICYMDKIYTYNQQSIYYINQINVLNLYYWIYIILILH